MGFRVAGIWKHPRSKILWFRMAVPERFRAAIGKREIKESLHTTDADEARRRHAAKLSETLARFASIEASELADIGRRANQICELGFDRLARSNLARRDDGVSVINNAFDSVVLGMLTFLSYRTRLTWGVHHAIRAEVDLTGEADGDVGNDLDEPLGFIDAETQNVAAERISAFEPRADEICVDIDGEPTIVRGFTGGGRYRGLGHREIARALLMRRNWEAAEFEVLLVAERARAEVKLRSALYDALAECVLRRLAEHRFLDWPENYETLAPPLPVAVPAIEPLADDTSANSHHLGDALKIWRERRGLSGADQDKSSSEWKLAMSRFVELNGDLPVDRIRKGMVTAFRDTLAKLPTRAKGQLAALPLLEQIKEAERRKLPRLSPPSVEKNVTAIRSLLGIALEYEWVEKNVAAGVTVEGAAYVGDERDRLTDADMKKIYGSPLMTDPEACDDTMFWIMFMAPLQGARPGEHCKLKPEEVTHEDGVPLIRIRRDRGGRGASQGNGRRQKTTMSIRDVPVHRVLVNAGFMAFAQHQQKRGAAWLFDDLPDAVDRYKTLSQRIMRSLRGLGISDPQKSFYSTRHTMKRETRDKRIAEQNADQLAGHSSGRIGRKYGQGVGLAELKEDIDKLEYATVDWEAVIRCANARVARLKRTGKLFRKTTS